jgi:CRISPR-associated protein Cmr4
MFEQRSLLFLYSLTPVHAGTGTTIGVIDNPIQRERHTHFPMIAGSGIKGSLRDVCRQKATDDELDLIFGPPPDRSSEHAGASSFTDAQIVLFPVRSLKQAFCYVTCPTALAVLRRMLSLAQIRPPGQWPERLVSVPEEKFIPLGKNPPESLILEAFEFRKDSQSFPAVGEWLSARALPDEPAFQYFREKLKTDTVLIGDEAFGYFVRNATLVEPHVRIDDASGTAQEGGLFYVENLPPESLLVSLLLASRVRKKTSDRGADWVVRWLKDKLGGSVVQLGGDSTTGRGQVLINFVTAEEPHA